LVVQTNQGPEKGANMIIVGCDYHPGFQQIAYVDTETGELKEQRLEHPELAEKFYCELASQGETIRLGMEASGHARWFERLLAELNIELWIGDAAKIRAKRVRKHKTDRQDAQHILQLLGEDRFPQIWVASWENRDLRQLLWHRHRMVQARTRIMNQLQAVALNEGLRCKKKLWREQGRKQLEAYRLAPWASRRREDLLKLLDELNPTIAELTSHRPGSGEICRSRPSDDTSWGWPVNRPGLRIDHRKSGAISVRQADRCLLGVSAPRRLERRTASAGTYHQTRQLDAALLIGGVGPGGGAKYSALAEPVLSPGDATGTKDRQSRHGQEAGGSLVLDDAPGMGL